MHKSVINCALPLLALAACHAHVDVGDRNDQSGDNVHVAMKDNGAGGSAVSVNVPGFNANVSLPGLDLGSHVDLDGITLAPDTKVSGINVDAQDGPGNRDEGNVRLGFTNPHAPAAVIDHYARSAAAAGYAGITRANGSISARKDDKTFSVSVTPDGSGSRGTITVQGRG